MIQIDLISQIFLSLSVLGLLVVTLARDVNAARKLALAVITCMLAAVLLSIRFSWLAFSDPTTYQTVVFILLGNLLAAFYTPAFMGEKKTFALIFALNLLSFMIWTSELGQMIWMAVPTFFLILTVAHLHDRGMLRLLLLFAVITSSLIAVSLSNPDAASHSVKLLELGGLIFIMGLFPLSPWYSRLFERSSTGLLAASFIMQVIFVLKLEKQQSLVRDDYLFVLPLMATFSLLMAIAQPCARRALCGLAASQLAFLAFALSGEHFSDKASILLADSQLVTIPGLILTMGILEVRIGRLSLARPSGHYDSYPKLATCMLLFGLMGAGFPLSLAYVAEDLVLESGIHESLYQGVAWLVVTALAAIAVIKMYLYLFHGGRGHEVGMDILSSKLIAAVLASVFLIVSSVLLPA